MTTESRAHNVLRVLTFMGPFYETHRTRVDSVVLEMAAAGYRVMSASTKIEFTTFVPRCEYAVSIWFVLGTVGNVPGTKDAVWVVAPFHQNESPEFEVARVVEQMSAAGLHLEGVHNDAVLERDKRFECFHHVATLLFRG